jgi:hypothetical protein
MSSGARNAHQAVGHDHGRSAGRDRVEPGGVGQVGADVVGVGRRREQLPAGGDDLGEVDVVPVDGGRRGDAEHAGVQPGPQVEADRVGVAADEVPGHLVELPGPQGDVEDGAGAEVEPAAVVADLVNDLLSHRVAEDGMPQVVVQRPAT